MAMPIMGDGKIPMPTDSRIDIFKISTMFRWTAGIISAIFILAPLSIFGTMSSDQASLVVLIGFIFGFIFLVLACNRKRSFIDLRQRKLIALKGIGPWCDRTETDLGQVSEIAFSPREKRTDSDGESYFVTVVTGDGPGTSVMLSEFRSILEAKTFATRVSRALGVSESPTIQEALPIPLAQVDVLPDLERGNQPIPTTIALSGVFSPFSLWRFLCSMHGGLLLFVGLFFLYGFVVEPSRVSVNGRPGVFVDAWICIFPIALGLLLLRHPSRWIDVPSRRTVETAGFFPWAPWAPRNEIFLADVTMIDLPHASFSSEYGESSFHVIAIRQGAPLLLRSFPTIQQASQFAVIVAKALHVPVGSQVILQPNS